MFRLNFFNAGQREIQQTIATKSKCCCMCMCVCVGGRPHIDQQRRTSPLSLPFTIRNLHHHMSFTSRQWSGLVFATKDQCLD